MLDGMTGHYCTGESEETSKTETAEGYPGKTCRKALSVFYATCKEKGLDYSQPMPKEKVREHVQAILPFKVLEKIVDKPLRIRGIAMTAGMSRNFNIYTPEELQNFANKLVSAPVYVEHVAVPNACGKVTKTEWDGQNLWYEAEIFEGDVADKIRKGLIQHVSVGADYDVLDVVDGKIPHGLHNAELSLVAVPGIPETNVQILESLQRAKEQQEICLFCGKNAVEFWLGCCSECFENLPIAEVKRKELLEQRKKMREQQGFEPIIAGEYYLGYVQDPALFMPEHFRTVWIDQPNGVLAVMAKLRADPAQERCQSILFLKSKWQPNTVKDWLTIHPDYVAPASVSASQNTPRGIENMSERDKLLEKVHEDLIKSIQEDLEKKLLEFMNQVDIKKIIEAEWDTEYINGLSDSAFAVIGDGGQKDDQGKMVPRTLRHLPHHNAEGSLDLPHLRNALARMNQIEPASLQAEAKRHLCAHAKESDIVSEFCGEEPGQSKEKKLNQCPNNLAESLLRNPPKEAVVQVKDAIALIESVLPSAGVERSWGFGPQRFCQEIRGVILKLQERTK